MKRLRFIAAVQLLLISCNHREPIDVQNEVEIVQEATVVKLNNPAIFMGCSFGVYIQSLHEIGKYNEMLAFTSISTRKKFGNEKLLSFFKQIQFSFPLKLKAITKQDEIQTLMYSTSIDATKKTIQINVAIENDTCRIVLDTLNPIIPFIGI